MSKRYSDQRVPGTKSPDGAGRDSLLRIDLNTFRFVPFLLCALAISVRADLPSARLLTVSPAGGQAGSAVEVTVSGKDLDDLAGLHISSPGLSATLKSGSVFTVRIGMDTPPGVYDLRAVGKYGASNPRAFSVGLAREIGAMEENNSPARAQLVPLGTTVNGRSKADAGQYFRVAARNGDYIVARCEATAIDSRFEPVLELIDASGRELASSLNRGSIGFLVRQNGELVVGLHDVIYRGGAEYFYRLSIGNFPSIDSITPLALVGTNTARFEVVGHNLPGGKKTGESADDADGRRWDKGHKVKGGEKAGAARDPFLERIEIELSPNDPRVRRALTRLPAEAGEDIFECRLQSERGVSEPALFTFPSGALQTEGSAQHAPDSGRVVSLPWEANGGLR